MLCCLGARPRHATAFKKTLLLDLLILPCGEARQPWNVNTGVCPMSYRWSLTYDGLTTIF